MPNHTTISTLRYRVQLHPSTDWWMKGARYGEVMREYKGASGRNMVLVKLDRVDKPQRLLACDVEPIS